MTGPLRPRLGIPVLIIIMFIISCSGLGDSPEISSIGITDIETGIDPDSWITIPAGEFYMGQHLHETTVDYDYEIMVTDVTNDQYARFLNQALGDGAIQIIHDPELGEQIVGYYPGDEFHGHEHEEEIPPGDYLHIPIDDPGFRFEFDGKSFTPIPGYQNHPMVLVTWFGAKAFCEQFGWRLPTEVEWEKAARGETTLPFPWGDQIDQKNANYYSSYDIFEKTFDKQGNTTPVGMYNGSTYGNFITIDSPSPYGLYDMAGNVWQWTGDVYPGQHYRYMRGGSKDNYAYNLRIWTRNSAGPTYYSPSVGFRCVRENGASE